MILSDDSTCSYHCCDQTGHSVCQKVGDHYRRLMTALSAILEHPDTVLPEGHGPALRAIMAEIPDTSTTT